MRVGIRTRDRSAVLSVQSASLAHARSASVERLPPFLIPSKWAGSMLCMSKTLAGVRDTSTARARGAKGGKAGSRRYGVAHLKRIGSKGGKAWAKSLTASEMSAHARKAARARWGPPKRKAKRGRRGPRKVAAGT